MALIVKDDEQIKVGTTTGLVAASSSFTFDGTLGTPDYRKSEIVITPISINVPLVKGVDYSWNSATGQFEFLTAKTFESGDIYNIHFRPTAQPIGQNHISLINGSFFIRDINLVNLNVSQVSERVNSFIRKYESECLTKILGKDLYDLILSENSQRIEDLLYGADYLSAIDVTRNWQGIVHGESESLIANYIYFFFQEANAKQTSGVATKAPKAESAESVSPADKMVSAWRFFGSETRGMCCFLWNSRIGTERVYPEFTVHNYNYTMSLARKGGVNKFGF